MTQVNSVHMNEKKDNNINNNNNNHHIDSLIHTLQSQVISRTTKIIGKIWEHKCAFPFFFPNNSNTINSMDLEEKEDEDELSEG